MSKTPPAQIKTAASKVKKNPEKGALPATSVNSAKTQAKPALAANAKTTTAKAPVTSATKPAVKTVAKPVTKTTGTKTAPINTTATKAKNVKKLDDKKPKIEKPKSDKVKMERDSFTMPKDEYAQIAVLKTRLTALGQPAKKSELLRAGIKLLAAMSDNTLKTTLAKIPVIKTGRPNKKD